MKVAELSGSIPEIVPFHLLPPQSRPVVSPVRIVGRVGAVSDANIPLKRQRNLHSSPVALIPI